MAGPQERRLIIAAFVRGYFQWLETQGVPAALLHGWESGFEGPISDVDYVVGAKAFPTIAQRVHDYCQSAGWRLCQVLRHEDTAAFCVCSADDDPGCVVALDACSDYQRNGLVFLRASEMLEGRQSIDWGGFRLSPAMELRYRFIKAAAKAKLASDILPDLLDMNEAAKSGFGDWLAAEWNIRLNAWSRKDLEIAMTSLTRRCGPASSRFRIGNFKRLARRIAIPDGLLLLAKNEDYKRTREVIDIFSGLYFRRHEKVDKASLRQRMSLIRSTLVIASTADLSARVGLTHDCILSTSGSLSSSELIQQIADHLHRRCLSRERMN